MFIYADESGHTGKHIFNKPPFYFQGAILSVEDTEPVLRPIAEHYKKKFNISRLHANELPQPIVEEIALSFLKNLTDTNWIFHITVLEKQYLSVTKFVDSIFDSGENKGARWLWYNHEFFRHSLCCFFDDLLPVKIKQEFWQAYLKDNYQDVCGVVKYALDQLDDSIDKRLREVVSDGLSFILENPKEITLLANETKKSYKGHTPNMVAFISLLQTVHRFCEKHNVTPSVFIHDPQSEFGSTMRKWHKLHFNVKINESRMGLPQSPEMVEHGLGEFSLCPSNDVVSLQAVDVFLWLSQRGERIKNPELSDLLQDRTEPFYISRAMSEMIRTKWAIEFSGTELSDEQIQKGKMFVKKLEDIHHEKLRKFKTQQIDGKKNESLHE